MMELPTSFSTKAERLEFYREKLRASPKWALRALEVIGGYQTQEEQTREQTIEHNGVGFSGRHGEILTSFYGQVARWHQSATAQAQYPGKPLSDKQMIILHRIIPAYAAQLLRHLDASGEVIPVINNRRKSA